MRDVAELLTIEDEMRMGKLRISNPSTNERHGNSTLDFSSADHLNGGIYSRRVEASFLIVCPLSILRNWKDEFNLFVPKVCFSLDNMLTPS